jgi:hypothetical protein
MIKRIHADLGGEGARAFYEWGTSVWSCGRSESRNSTAPLHFQATWKGSSTGITSALIVLGRKQAFSIDEGPIPVAVHLKSAPS